VRGAESLTNAAATGQAEMIDVVTAVAAAEVQLETVIAVRDQVIRAYQEILRMPI
jgi:flagellar hook-basal body complex protein FliE